MLVWLVWRISVTIGPKSKLKYEQIKRLLNWVCSNVAYTLTKEIQIDGGSDVTKYDFVKKCFRKTTNNSSTSMLQIFLRDLVELFLFFLSLIWCQKFMLLGTDALVEGSMIVMMINVLTTTTTATTTTTDGCMKTWIQQMWKGKQRQSDRMINSKTERERERESVCMRVEWRSGFFLLN